MPRNLLASDVWKESDQLAHHQTHAVFGLTIIFGHSMARPNRLKQKAWDVLNPRYASLDHPEWVAMSRLPNGFWLDPHNHQRYFKWITKKLGIKKPEDWYQVRSSDFIQNRGGGFLSQYQDSHMVAIQKLIPQFEFLPWLFTVAPAGYWKDLSNVKKYLNWFAKQRGFKKKSDWYQIGQDDFYALHGHGMMARYNCSVWQVLNLVYPNYKWKPWLFKQTSKRFWTQKKNRIKYMKWLGKKLKFKKPEDWYRVIKLDFINNNGGSLMAKPKSQVIDFVRELYPKRDWIPWLFIQVSQSCWKKKSNRVEYMKWLGKRLGFNKQDDWYKIKVQDFDANNGWHVFSKYYKSDFRKALKELYPKSGWLLWKFPQLPEGFWDSPKSVRKYLNWLAKQIGCKKKTDWYSVSISKIKKNHGSGFMRHFRTLPLGLAFAYPNYQWLPWLFSKTHDGFWDKKKNRIQYYRWLGKQLKFKTKSDWNSLTAKKLTSFRGQSLFARFSLKQIVREAKYGR